MIKVVLKPSEYAMAAYLASVRDYVNKDFGVTDKKMGQDDGFLIGVDGLVGEFGVCKHFNVCPDLSFEPRKGGPDCVINKAKTDVKSTKPGKTNFYIPEWKAKHNIDSYVFCYVNFRTVEILGFLTSQDIFKQDNLEPSPKKGINHYALSIDKLRKIPE